MIAYRVGVVGSRRYPDLRHVTSFVTGLPEAFVVVSGGARGADQAAEWAADARNLETQIHRPDIKKGAPRAEVIAALFARNTLIADGVDELHAFFPHGQRSSGTFDTVLKAKRRQKYIMIHWAEPDGTGGFNDVSKPLPGLAPPLKQSLERFIYHWEAQNERS